MNRMTAAAGTVVAGFVLLALTGCQPSDQPTVVATPSIDWQPAAPVVADPYAAAVLEAELGSAIAFNARDFTVDQLTSTTTAARVDQMYESFRAQYVVAGAEPRVYAGPRPYTVLGVVRSGDDSAEVTVCSPESEWWIEQDHREPQANLDVNAVEITYRVVTEDGDLRVADASVSQTECDASGAELGLFKPAPELIDSISENDIRPPL